MPAALLALILILSIFCLGAQATGAPPDSPQVIQESEVILMLALDEEPVSDSFVAVERSGRLFIPVCAVAESVSLAINCIEDRAFGFILSESRPFAMDLKEGYAISGRNAYKINDAAFMHGTDVFADINELSKWLPVDFAFKKEISTVQMHAREVLPVQGFKKRQKLKRAPVLLVPKQFDDFTPAKGVASVPTIDLISQILLSGEHGDLKSSTLNSLSLSGDLLYMSGEAHILAANDILKRFDLSLSRRSDSGFMVGPVPVTQLLIGTTQAPNLDGIGTASTPMYGLILSNRPISEASKFLTHDINGYLPAGWDAELLYNGSPISYQPPTQDGMYHFENLRVQYGSNEFKVILHGPFGETRELEQTIVSDATTPAGKLFYTLSGGWETGLTRSNSAGPDPASNVTMTSDFGLTQGIAGSALLMRQTDNFGAEQEYAGIGIRTAVGYTLLSFDLLQSFSPAGDKDGQLFTARSSSRDIFGASVQVEQRLLRNFDSLRFPKMADPLLSRTIVKLSSSLSIWDHIRFPLSVQIGLDAKRSGECDWASVWRGAGGWYGWNGALEAEVSYLQRALSAVGMLQISTKVKDVSVRGQLGFTMAPTLTPSGINVNADKNLGNGFQLNSGIIHDPASHTSGLLIGVSKRFGLIGYAISATGSTTGAYSVNVGVSTSVAADGFNRQVVLASEPLSPSGMVAVSASTSTAQTGAPPGKEVPGVGFLVNGSRALTLRGSKGLPVIAFLQPDVPVNVTVDIATVEDPFMIPLEDGCRIIPRAGVVSACRFTMITGGEIDGMVMVKMKSEEVPLKEVRVDLMTAGPNPKLVASTLSQESGYYLFKAVKPGSYNIVLPEKESTRLKTAVALPIQAIMPEEGDQISGKDFMLEVAASDKKEVAGARGK